MLKKIIIKAYGHANVRSEHKTTLEITKESHLTPHGDCIVAVGADKGIFELPEEFKEKARDPEAKIQVILRANGMEEKIRGMGHPQLTFTHTTDFVIRKSDFICPRTLMIKADKSSYDLDRDFIRLLQDQTRELIMDIRILE